MCIEQNNEAYEKCWADADFWIDEEQSQEWEGARQGCQSLSAYSDAARVDYIFYRRFIEKLKSNSFPDIDGVRNFTMDFSDE